MTTAKIGGMGMVRHVSFTFLAKIAAAFLALLSSVIVSRSLGPDGRGAFAAAMSLATIGMQVANLGLPSSNTYFVAKDRTLLAPLMAHSLLISLGSGLLVALVLHIAMRFLPILQGVQGHLAGLALLWIPFGLAYMLLQNLLLGILAVNPYNLIEITMKTMSLLFMLGLFALGMHDASLYLAAGLAAMVLATGMVWRALQQPIHVITAYSLTLFKDQLPFAFRSYLATLFVFLLRRFDVLMVQHWAGNTEAGHYSIAVSMVDMLYMLPAAAGSILFPRLSGAKGSQERLRTTWRMSLHIAWLMAVGGLFAGLVAAPVVNWLFGPEFAPAVPMFYILIGAILFLSANNMLSNHLAAEGLPWAAVWLWLIALAINLVLNWFWIPLYGGKGAAFASLVGYAVAFALHACILLTRKETSP